MRTMVALYEGLIHNTPTKFSILVAISKSIYVYRNICMYIFPCLLWDVLRCEIKLKNIYD